MRRTAYRVEQKSRIWPHQESLELAAGLLSSQRRHAPPMDSDLARRQAIYELLAEPDPPDLHRGYVRRLDGKPDRHAQLPLLAAKFVQARLLEIRERAPLQDEQATA